MKKPSGGTGRGLRVAALAFACAIGAGIAGCGGGGGEATGWKGVLPLAMTENGPVLVNGAETPFADVAEAVKTLEAKPSTSIQVAVTARVPESRKQALANQLRKAGYIKVSFVISANALRAAKRPNMELPSMEPPTTAQPPPGADAKPKAEPKPGA
jgi:hypothetical protein